MWVEFTWVQPRYVCVYTAKPTWVNSTQVEPGFTLGNFFRSVNRALEIRNSLIFSLKTSFPFLFLTLTLTLTLKKEISLKVKISLKVEGMIGLILSLAIFGCYVVSICVRSGPFLLPNACAPAQDGL